MRYHTKFIFSVLLPALSCTLVPYLHAAGLDGEAGLQVKTAKILNIQKPTQFLFETTRRTPSQENIGFGHIPILTKITLYSKAGQKKIYTYLHNLDIRDEEDKEGALCALFLTILGISYILWRWYRVCTLLHQPTQKRLLQSQHSKTNRQYHILRRERSFLPHYHDHMLLPRFSNV